MEREDTEPERKITPARKEQQDTDTGQQKPDFSSRTSEPPQLDQQQSAMRGFLGERGAGVRASTEKHRSVREQYEQDKTVDVAVLRGGEFISVGKYKRPKLEDEYPTEPSPFLIALGGNVIFQAGYKVLEQEVERKKEAHRQAEKRYREKNPEEYKASQREKMREYRARKKLQEDPELRRERERERKRAYRARKRQEAQS